LRASRKGKAPACKHAGAWKTRKTVQLADEKTKPAADDLPGELRRRRAEGDVEKGYLSASRLMTPG
jgi:hypothetical protein